MQRVASVVWNGSLQQGNGQINAESGALKEVPYNFNTRFGEDPGTNPEELIAAAHASCFAMAASGALTKHGFEPETLNVTATVTINKEKDSWTVASSNLYLKGRVANVTQGQFLEIVEDAKKNCPISRLLKADINLTAELEEAHARPWAPPPPQ